MTTYELLELWQQDIITLKRIRYERNILREIEGKYNKLLKQIEKSKKNKRT